MLASEANSGSHSFYVTSPQIAFSETYNVLFLLMLAPSCTHSEAGNVVSLLMVPPSCTHKEAGNVVPLLMLVPSCTHLEASNVLLPLRVGTHLYPFKSWQCTFVVSPSNGSTQFYAFISLQSSIPLR